MLSVSIIFFPYVHKLTSFKHLQTIWQRHKHKKSILHTWLKIKTLSIRYVCLSVCLNWVMYLCLFLSWTKSHIRGHILMPELLLCIIYLRAYETYVKYLNTLTANRHACILQLNICLSQNMNQANILPLLHMACQSASQQFNMGWPGCSLSGNDTVRSFNIVCPLYWNRLPYNLQHEPLLLSMPLLSSCIVMYGAPLMRHNLIMHLKITNCNFGSVFFVLVQH